jgi:FkbM family methyltransferase
MVFAFEANPYNFKKIQLNNSNKSIVINNLAVSNFNGIGKFNIYDVNYADKSSVKGLSSLFAVEKCKETIETPVVRIDDYLISQDRKFSKIALWIDVEGANYEVLEGIKNISEKIIMIHTEVETKMWKNGQKIYTDIIKLMAKYNFVEVAKSFQDEELQGDIILVNKQFLSNITPLIRKFKYIMILIDTHNMHKLLAKYIPRQSYRKIKALYLKYLDLEDTRRYGI